MFSQEKRRHNLVRPTTVVQELKKDSMLEIWDGRTVDGNLFHPYIRTMPHAEYPSGSACLCTGVRDYGKQAFPFFYPDGTFGPDGTSPESTSISDTKFIQELADVVIATNTPFPDAPHTLDEMLEACSSSRLEAGLHFTKAVTEGSALCLGMGDKVWADMRSLLADEDDEAAREAIGATPVGMGGATDLQRSTECLSGPAAEEEFVMPTIDQVFWTTEMGLPPFASTHTIVMFWLLDTVTPALRTAETPIVIRTSYAITSAFWNCVAAFSNSDKVSFLKFAQSPPKVDAWTPAVDASRHTSDARSLCAVHALSAMLPIILPGETALEQYLAGPAASVFGLSEENSIGIPDQLKACEGDTTCMRDYVSCHGNTPKAMGEAIAQDVTYRFERDGWNSAGSCPDHEFCYPYADLTGYTPEEGTCNGIPVV